MAKLANVGVLASLLNRRAGAARDCAPDDAAAVTTVAGVAGVIVWAPKSGVWPGVAVVALPPRMFCLGLKSNLGGVETAAVVLIAGTVALPVMPNENVGGFVVTAAHFVKIYKLTYLFFFGET